MATVAHSTLTGAELHEPKGVASANANEIYVANGSGSGVWGKVGQLSLNGVSSTVSAGRFVATNSTGGFVLADTAHGTCYYATTTIPVTVASTINSTGNVILITTTAKGTPQSMLENTNGSLTYRGLTTADLDVVYNISFDIVSGSNKNIRFAIRKNNSVNQPESTSYTTVRSGEIHFASGHADMTTSYNDDISLWAYADSGDSLTLRIYAFSLMATTAGA